MKKETIHIIVDTRERTPLNVFHPLVCTLKTGDYTLEGYEDQVCIERKAKGDLFKSLGKDYKRFKAELIRMQKFKYRCILIEVSKDSVYKGIKFSKRNGISILRQLHTISVSYKIPIYFAKNRNETEDIIYILMDLFLNNNPWMESMV